MESGTLIPELEVSNVGRQTDRLIRQSTLEMMLHMKHPMAINYRKTHYLVSCLTAVLPTRKLGIDF